MTGPRENHLLAALPKSAWGRLAVLLQPVEMSPGQVLHESGDNMNYVYFPTTAIVSLMYITRSGASAEIALVGNEGVVGIALFMGGLSTVSRAIVQSAGEGFRLKAQAMGREFDRSGSVMHLFLTYTMALTSQIGQIAACNRHHSVDQQLCRWLLLHLDRLQGNELVVTQELIASMLGVRRESVTESAHKLQAAGLIRCVRGHVTVIDRTGLEKRTCECYAAVRNEYERLLPDPMHA